ncbi:MAG: hypothetical protein KDC07_03270, partial [Chitinophagaceae bacterium]|nr:hypothetical protein [Chitinophagaceae bacterium]
MASSESNSSAESGFFDRKATRDFGKATMSLTFILNVILAIAANITTKGISNQVMIILILVLSALYVLVFIKRAKDESLPQYTIASAINIALLFTSLTGTNKFLDNVKPSLPAGSATTTQASVSDILYHVIFPAQSIFSEKQEALEILNATEENINAASNIIGNIVTTNQESISSISSVVDSVRNYVGYIEDKYNAVKNTAKNTLNRYNEAYASAPPPRPAALAKPAPDMDISDENVSGVAAPEARPEEADDVQPDTVAQTETMQQLQVQQQQLEEQKQQLQKQKEELNRIRAK